MDDKDIRREVFAKRRRIEAKKQRLLADERKARERRYYRDLARGQFTQPDDWQ